MNHENYTTAKRQMMRACAETKTPVSGSFELTGRCNFDCKMCYVHVMDNEQALKEELSTQQWKDIFDQAYDAGLMYALLTGGECLIRPDFKELYLYLWDRGVNMNVNTNGSLIDEDMLDFFEQHRPRHMQITLYGADDEGYQAVTGRRVYEKVAESLLRLQEMKIPMKVALTISRFNYPYLQGMLDFLKEHSFDYGMSGFLLPPEEGLEREDYSLSLEQAVQARLMLERSHGRTHEPVDPATLPAPGGEGKEEKRGINCMAGKSMFSINWRGFMEPCMAVNWMHESVLELGFARAWEKTVARCAQYLRPRECSDCAYQDICSFCPASRDDGTHSGHCNKNACERAVALRTAGIKRIK